MCDVRRWCGTLILGLGDLVKYRVLQEVQQQGTKHPNYSWDGIFLRRKGKIMVENDVGFRQELFQHFHVSALRGHSRVHATKGLPSSKGKNAILVVVDRLTKYGHFMELTHPYTATTVAQEFVDSVYKLHGMPDSIIADKDRHTGRKVLNQKLAPKFFGPFKVEVAYRLQLPQGSKVHPTFYVSKLKKHVGVVFVQANLPLVDTQRAWGKEHIRRLDRRMVRRGNKVVTEVLVEWTNSFLEDATWESFQQLKETFPHIDPWGQ
ncbi:reverse transcriptase [Gossypium australe]|uniref:Reverse transcriptase n=1 Tax=Gossypium australe TaxID=47621 RepID=A0A5B6UT78_9ROSI|nr:reverse transcriptase [Gossypium australe]